MKNEITKHNISFVLEHAINLIESQIRLQNTDYIEDLRPVPEAMRVLALQCTVIIYLSRYPCPFCIEK